MASRNIGDGASYCYFIVRHSNHLGSIDDTTALVTIGVKDYRSGRSFTDGFRPVFKINEFVAIQEDGNDGSTEAKAYNLK